MRRSVALIALYIALLFVCVASLHAAQYYKFDGRWGSYGTGPSQFNYPTGLCLDADGKLYVADYYNNRIQRFKTDMTYLGEWGTYGSSDGQFNYPWGVAISGEKKVYVTDSSGSNNSRVQIFQLTGFFLSKFGGYGSSTGQFYNPRGLALDSSNNVYVADFSNHRIQKFNKSGGFITTWGGYGTGDTNLYGPSGVAWAPNGYVYVADSYNHRIMKFTNTGTYVAKWGASGTGNSQFNYPFGIAVDKNNMVYVADTSNNRIQKFDANGVWKDTWGQSGSGDGQFNNPYAVHVGTDLKVWVCEYYNHRVQRFRPNKAPTAPTKVTVKPLPAYDKTDLTANATGSTDIDGDALAYRYQWWKSSDNVTFTTGPALKVLKNTETTVGQFWKVQAWAYDGIARSPKVYGDVIEIRGANTKPTAPTSVVITPKNPVDDTKLTATASGATDADGDTLVYRYQWQKSTDGTTWTNGPAKRFLDPAETSVGQWWRCQARAYDGTAVGPIKTSAKVQIGSGTASVLALTASAQGGKVAQIVVSLSAPAVVRVMILNLAGVVVAELPARDLEAGISTLSWNGMGSTGAKVPGGAYLTRVTAVAPNGGQASVLAPMQR